MAAGQFREFITVLTASAAVSDGQGGWLPGAAPDTETTLHARVEALNGRALLALGQTVTGQAYKVTIRANGPIRTPPQTRLRWRGLTMTVQVVMEDERRRLIELTCFDNGRA